MPSWLLGIMLLVVVIAQLSLCWLLYTIAQGLMAALDRINHLSHRRIRPSRNGKPSDHTDALEAWKLTTSTSRS